ncbi:PDZ domain-containing protein [bacterium]|nr:PDZ domain-containing protein [bacterium]
MFRKYFSFALIVVLFATTLIAQQTQPNPPAQVAMEPAISSVYPALVQIRVVSASYDDGRQRKNLVAGSGVIISPDGYVVTNHHVAGKATSIRCFLSSKKELEAKLVGTDALTDIAVLKIDVSSLSPDEQKLPYAKFGSSESLKIGDPVLAMGSPLALSQSVTRGIVANKDMMFPDLFGSDLLLDGEDVGLLVKWIGHDAQILPGNSGGPLVNLQGEIVGINEISLGGFFGGGIGGAIPSELVKKVSDELIAHSVVRRVWVGMNFQPLLKSHRSTGVSNAESHGVLVSSVMEGSPAERAGIVPGDIILSIDGNPVNIHFREELPALHQFLLAQPAQKKLDFLVQHAKDEGHVELTTEIRDDVQGKQEELNQWGLVVEDLTTTTARELGRPDKKGVMVSSAKNGGPADQASPPLEEGDVIVEINGKPVENRQSMRQLTSEITKDKKAPVSTLVSFDRNVERLLTVVDVGIKVPQQPPPEARKAYLPITTQVLTKKLANALGVPGKKGVRITGILAGSSAEKAGFKVNDIITQVADQPVDASEAQHESVLESMLRAYRINSQLEFTVIRDTKEMKITATLSEQPKPHREMKVYENIVLEFKGRDISYDDRIELNYDQSERGVLVTEVEPGGWASVGGLHEDDLIQAINGQKVIGIGDVERILTAEQKSSSKYIVIFVKRGIYTYFLELQPVWTNQQTGGGT